MFLVQPAPWLKCKTQSVLSANIPVLAVVMTLKCRNLWVLWMSIPFSGLVRTLKAAQVNYSCHEIAEMLYNQKVLEMYIPVTMMTVFHVLELTSVEFWLPVSVTMMRVWTCKKKMLALTQQLYRDCAKWPYPVNSSTDTEGLSATVWTVLDRINMLGILREKLLSFDLDDPKLGKSSW